MTLPAILAKHDHITERETDGTWEDCTWCSGVEFMRLAYNASLPATHAEAEALRKASGDSMTGGSNMGDFRKGVAARYHQSLPPVVKGFADLWTALVVGTVAVVQGSMVAFPPAHRLSRFDTHFDGGHAVMVARVDATDRVWWCDPEGTDTGYLGEFITKAELKAYVSAFAGEHIVAPIKVATPAPQEATMDTLLSNLTGSIATVKVNSNIRLAPKIAATKVRTTTAVEKHALVGIVSGDKDPANGSTEWYVWYEGGTAVFTAKDNVTSVAAPTGAPAPDDGFTAATQAAAVAAQKTADALLLTAAVRKATTEATTAEKNRIAAAEAARIKAL